MIESGFRPASSATSEQVAAKPTPAKASRGKPLRLDRLAHRLGRGARQMSADDCSTASPGSRQSAIGRLALASSRPRASNAPARALPVPTSTPTNAFVIAPEAALLAERANSDFPTRLTSEWREISFTTKITKTTRFSWTFVSFRVKSLPHGEGPAGAM